MNFILKPNLQKGVLLPQSVLTAQARSLHEAWEYSPSDHLLHLLPLHHIHGVVNAILTPLLAGSSIEFMFPFNADAVWNRLATPFLPASESATTNGTTNGDISAASKAPKPKVTFFTAVPTIYSRLLTTHKSLPPPSRTPPVKQSPLLTSASTSPDPPPCPPP